MHFDHDHCEREDVRLLAVCPLIQDLWRSPSRGVTTMTRNALLRVQVLSDRRETKIHDARGTGAVYKNVRLVECQYGSEMRSKSLRTPLRSP